MNKSVEIKQEHRLQVSVQETGNSTQYVLKTGAVILGGRYRITQVLAQRPRLNLYMGEQEARKTEAQEMPQTSPVAIRELLCGQLSPLLRAQIEAAVDEEFSYPISLGSAHLVEAGNRVYHEGERLYLIMQLQSGNNMCHLMTLEELLLTEPRWPTWLNIATALQWMAQLGRMVARLHRLGVILGNVTPATIGVDNRNTAPWLPILLPGWPPPPQFWSLASAEFTSQHLYQQVFPIARLAADNPFAAPEMLQGKGDERADVYTLGAILYLLVTHYAPIAVERQLCYAQARKEQIWLRTQTQEDTASSGQGKFHQPLEGLPLIESRLLNKRISPALERVLSQALALNPARRYPSAFALVEALEGL